MSSPLIFRPQTWDRNIWDSVMTGNEYKLSGAFHADDVVIDIGAHIGAFSCRVLDMGAGRVVAVECEPDNFLILRHNLHEACCATDRAVLVYGAAVGVPLGQRMRHVYAAATGTNTGGTSCIGENGRPVAALHFDALVTLARSWNGRPVRLLKLDCEGGEWPILDYADFSSIRAVVGEYHSIEDIDQFPALALNGPRNRAWLVARLKGQGYTVATLPTSPHLGLFWAWRSGAEFSGICAD